MNTATAHRFYLGATVATPAALDVLIRLNVNIAVLLARHVTGDWGDMTPEDKARNEAALIADADGFFDRVFSSYLVGPGRDVKVWIITESDRSSTTVLLPSDY